MSLRKIEVRLTGNETWEGCEVQLCESLQITSNGDLVVLGTDSSKPVGQDEGRIVFATTLQHGYAAGEWAQFRDAGHVETEGTRQ